MISAISTSPTISTAVSVATNSVQSQRTTAASSRFVDTFESSDGRVATRANTLPASLNDDPQRNDQNEYREVFHRFVGETLFAQMLKSMRASQQPLPYIGGGRAEEIFQGQLDQVLVEKLTAGTPDSLSDTMFRMMNARQKMPQG